MIYEAMLCSLLVHLHCFVFEPDSSKTLPFNFPRLVALF